ncbi:hypothetical protein NDU88_003359 [Pleurodeles waltl]|uniref:Uncharacterized protein n=1 Tax=Pleurodeles waltl TaxID=8319 RepID=A0AAV7W766_PLEWA|nr:hypothetical protein NDU88_003359 [Pleurodeles waltl]
MATADMLTMGRSKELSRVQAAHMESALMKAVKVEPGNAVVAETTVKRKEKRTGGNRTCYMCGGGYQHQGKCPAAGKQCTNCHRLNHFAKVCHSTSKTKSARPKMTHKARVVQQQEDLQDMDDDDEPEGAVYVIHATHPGNIPRRRIPRCRVTVAGHHVTALIDTGASINILAQSVFSQIPKCPQLRPATLRVFASGSATPIPLAGMFVTDITQEDVTTRAKIYVAEVGTGMLLRCCTAEELELVTFALSIHVETL